MKHPLDQLLAPYLAYLHRDLLKQLKRETRKMSGLDLITFLMTRIDEQRALTKQNQQHFDRFKMRCRGASTRARNQHILDFSTNLGATPSEIRQDRRALKRFLDEEAMEDRFHKIQAKLTAERVLLLERLGACIVPWLREQKQREQACHSLSLETFLSPDLHEDSSPPIARAAITALQQVVQTLSISERPLIVSEFTRQHCLRIATDKNRDCWQREAALHLLVVVVPDQFHQAFIQLTAIAEDDDIFLRAAAVQFLPSLPPSRWPALQKDPSEHVRGAFAKIVGDLEPKYALPMLKIMIEDSAQSVRAHAVLALGEHAKRYGHRNAIQEVLTRIMQEDTSPFCARVAMKVAVECAWADMCRSGKNAEDRRHELEDALRHVHLFHPQTPVRRQAAMYGERLWCWSQPEARSLYAQLRTDLKKIREGDTVRLNASVPTALLPRVLAVLAQDGFELNLEKGLWGLRVRKSRKMGFRFWRFLHEMRNPSPDKRQGFDHTVGRHSNAHLRAPSAILAEVSQTKVPGEPLFLSEEQGWRPYLPLPDDLLCCLDMGPGPGSLELTTAEGITQLRAPRSFFKRLRAWWHICTHYAELAGHRNWRESDGLPPNTYAQAIRKLGFDLKLQPHHGDPNTDQRIHRFFVFSPFAFLNEHFRAFREYMHGIYTHSLLELGIISATAFTAFVTHHWWQNRVLNAARSRISLVIGGWGTRGKSGTERLKAALMGSLGFRTLSKTTGCEARILLANGFGKQWEIPLFRPMNKATIWEQENVLCLADKLGTQALLWECMGLNPTNVGILRDWMRDDLSTITNAYPDHEDIQGPAGHNVARVISTFIPKKARVFSSEHNMLPLLQEQARKKKSHLHAVDWQHSGLLAKDVLDSFPYQEHPDNIALVVSMAKHLGVPEHFALKEMADKVVPDLGVLKEFKPVKVGDVTLSLVNGMSANERLGCLSNWQRLGFDQKEKRPDQMVTVLINNRADRIARSKVFAQMTVEDLPADLYVLVGSNVGGLVTYIKEAFEAIVTCPSQPDQEWLANICARLNLAIDLETQRQYLDVILKSEDISEVQRKHCTEAMGDSAVLKKQLSSLLPSKKVERLCTWLERERERQEISNSLRQAVTEGRPQEVERLLWQWFSQKIVALDDPATTTSHLIQSLVEHTRPGASNRVLAACNIKGPGIALMSCFQAWESFEQHCQEIEQAQDPNVLLQQLRTLKDPGLLGRQRLAQLVKALGQPETGKEVRAELERLNVFLQSQSPETQSKQSHPAKALFIKCVGLLERFLEAGEAVRRRKRANLIYRSLADSRIGMERANRELQALNYAQESGWLWRRIAGRKS